MSDGSAFQSPDTWPGDEKALSVMHEAEYVKQRSCCAHWIEAGCHYNAGRVLTDIVEQYHD